MDVKIYSLFSGSSGNCTWFKIGDLQFLVDAGGSCKAINEALKSLSSSLDEISHIFVTHEHSDHVKGLPVICRRYKPTVHIHKDSFKSSAALCEALDPELVDFFDREIHDLELTPGVKISSVATSHDSRHSCAYVVECFGRIFAVATDMGYVSRGLAERLTGAHSLILESNYDEEMLKNGPYPDYLKYRIASERGHLDNRVSARFAAYLAMNGTSNIVLGHLSEENNSPNTAVATLEAHFKELGIDYFCDNEEFFHKTVEKSVEKVDNSTTHCVKSVATVENSLEKSVEKDETVVEKLEKSVENPPKTAILAAKPVENSEDGEICAKGEKNASVRVAVAARYSPTLIFEGSI